MEELLRFFKSTCIQIAVCLMILVLGGNSEAFSQTKSLRKVFQIDGLTEYNNFVVYKKDTFNLKDSKGLTQGEGLWIIKDSTYGGEMISYSGYGSKGGCVSTED